MGTGYRLFRSRQHGLNFNLPLLSLMTLTLSNCTLPYSSSGNNTSWNQNAYTAVARQQPPNVPNGNLSHITWQDAPYYGQPLTTTPPNTQVASYRGPVPRATPPLAPLPRATPPLVAAPRPQVSRPPIQQNGQQHTVSAGENLYRISQRYGVPLSSLKVANGIQDDVIYPGQSLIIP